jgi:hypothetical protein
LSGPQEWSGRDSAPCAIPESQCLSLEWRLAERATLFSKKPLPIEHSCPPKSPFSTPAPWISAANETDCNAKESGCDEKSRLVLEDLSYFAAVLAWPSSSRAILADFAEAWERKNPQIVLHGSVINQLPSAPDVVAVDCS